MDLGEIQIHHHPEYHQSYENIKEEEEEEEEEKEKDFFPSLFLFI